MELKKWLAFKNQRKKWIQQTVLMYKKGLIFDEEWIDYF